MRLWHQRIIPLLDTQRLCDQHRTCCALRGRGWGKSNRIVNWVWDDRHGENALAVYHGDVLVEMDRRGFNYGVEWLRPDHRGKYLPPRDLTRDDVQVIKALCRSGHVYEHQDNEFLLQDLRDLISRGAGTPPILELYEEVKEKCKASSES